MRNPFEREPGDLQELEPRASEFFCALNDEELPEAAAYSIRASMLAALAGTGRAVGSHGRFAFAGSAFVAPLLAIGAVSAAAGESPVGSTMGVIESAVSAVGIGGNSGEVRNDIENRAEQAQDFGQPGSQPGNTSNAPGLNAALESEPAATEPSASNTEEESAPEEKLPPHENRKGCDDVLFANGEPPFASPGGPVGCEVGNSGEHRKNGAKQADDDESPAEEPAAAPTDDETEDKPGGVSHGLGKGHEEEKPGNGNGYGHTKHEHEPNPNGNGPGGPNAPDEEPEPVQPTTGGAPSGSGNGNGKGNGNGGSGSGAPGNSGNAKGKNK